MSIKIENTQVFGWELAIEGARNPMNSWEKSDTKFIDHEYEGDYHYHTIRCSMGFDDEDYDYIGGGSEEGRSCHEGDTLIGPNDYKLLMNLCKGGTEEAKWRRMIHVQINVTAPLYWWKEFETYKVGTVSSSCSTMHKIHSKEFVLDDFDHRHLCDTSIEYLKQTIDVLNFYRDIYNSFDEKSMDLDWFKSFVEKYGLKTKKDIWWQMIQLLPSSYNQRRTIDLNYEVLTTQYRQRKNHKLDEWREYCEWIKTLPYSEFITMKEE